MDLRGSNNFYCIFKFYGKLEREGKEKEKRNKLNTVDVLSEYVMKQPINEEDTANGHYEG